MTETGRMPQLEYIEKPDRRQYPYCDYKHHERKHSTHLIKRAMEEHPSHPESTTVTQYKRTLMAAKVRPIDIVNCVKAFKERIGEQGNTTPQPQPVELFIDRGK
jgi:hypothetical protein